MKVYSIFDDFTGEAKSILVNAGIDISINPVGVPRPDHDQMKAILRVYDGVIIGTSQQITEDMFDGVESPRIIATASVGLDHIKVPKEKKHLVTIVNTPKANAQSVAEYTMGCALTCAKRLIEGSELYKAGKDNKALFQKPEDLAGKTIGVIGAGNVSVRIMDYALFLGMDVLCWTKNPNKHRVLEDKGITFVDLEDLVKIADVISVNLPNNANTKMIISSALVNNMKNDCIFISVSRLDTIDFEGLIEKANKNPSFYLCLDLDVNKEVALAVHDMKNVIVTPHIAGGTVETRKRMFREVAIGIVNCWETLMMESKNEN